VLLLAHHISEQVFVSVTYSDIVGRESGADVVVGVTDDGADGDSLASAAGGAAHLDAVLSDGSTDAVTGRDDPVGVHDRAAAAERAAAQPSCLPAPLVGTGVLASDDVRVGAVTADGRGACYQSENDEHLHD
jgi:hypothetical protein